MPKKRSSKKKTTRKSRKRTYKKYSKKGYRLYKTPAVKTGTMAPIKFHSVWNGRCACRFPAGSSFSSRAMCFNPLIGNFCDDTDIQNFCIANQGAYLTYGYGTWFPDGMESNTPNFFINPYGNPNFRKFLLMYQEMKVDYIYVELQPEYQSGESIGSPFYLCHFEDRTYSGIGGSSIDKYISPNAMDRTQFETDFAQQGKKWKFFSAENRYYKYKVYMQAMGKEENKFYTTEQCRTIQTWKDDALPSPYAGLSVTGFYNQALFPYTWSAAAASRQIGFTPTIAFMAKLAKPRDSVLTISFSYRIKVGYTFRNPGCWVDKDTSDWKTKAWLQSPNHYLNYIKLTSSEAGNNPHWLFPPTQTGPYVGGQVWQDIGREIRAREDREAAAAASASAYDEDDEPAEPSAKRTETA